MNSYPAELLAQLAPIMFVAGLGQASLPSSPAPSTPLSPTSPKTQDQFTSLTTRLRESLLSQRKAAIWQPEKNKTFQVVLVDKEVRFPPRKLHPQDDHPNQTAHSPLSPLTTSSPLYPDGLIAPIWIRKHTTLVPSVFVLFLNLFEYPPHTPRSPLDGPDLDRERQREQEERKKDIELAAEIAQRKKSTNERGIKLTVVLIASRRMLDDPTLDARLTYVRRQGGLDSRAALFVLSPVSQTELNEFIQSLQQALYEPAVDYYTSHSKRVRRKRNRHAQSGTNYPVSLPQSAGLGRPLRPEGWTVRYEYKMACFAEFRGEDEVALKHYQDAYSALLVMFGSVAMLPPRTKRWAEAKVLADCIDIKVCKLYLYNNEHSLALSFHNLHIRKFGDLSRVWGIGEESFEFWSWVARQQRVLAELLEQGTRSNLIIPVHQPLLSEQASTQQNPQRSLVESDSMRALGLNPTQALQHPGFYYYMAARCTERRRERFLVLENEALNPGFKASPGFANERKVDHLALILELYTRSYELFKKYTPSTSSQQQNQSRLTLWIAYRIAQTYYESGKFDMAVKFFERIAKTYRREKWDSMLRPLLSTWYACAQQMGDMELSIRLLIEMLGQDSRAGDQEVTEEDLLAVLKSTVPTNPDEPLIVDLLESQQIFETSVYFWEPQVYVGQIASFQLCLSAPSGVPSSSLSFSSLAIYFYDDTSTPLIIRHSTSGSSDVPPKRVQLVDLGDVSASLAAPEGKPEGADGEVDQTTTEADLRWSAGSTIVFSGKVASNVSTIMKVVKAVLTLKEGNWWLEIPLYPSYSDTRGPLSRPIPRWLISDDPVRFAPMKQGECSTAIVRHRPHHLLVSISHHGPAYVDEKYPIQIDITNSDDRSLEIILDVLLQPVEFGDEAVNSIVFNGNESTGLIKGVQVGIMPPGTNFVKTLYLLNRGSAGDRVIDVSIQSRSMSSSTISSTTPVSPDTPTGHGLHDTNETLQTLLIPTVQAITMDYAVTYRRSLHQQTALSDLSTFESDHWDDGVGGDVLITSTLRCLGPWSLRFESIGLERKDNESAKLVNSSVEMLDEEDLALEWLPGDEFSDSCKVNLSVPENNTSSIAGPGQYMVTWRRLLPNGEPGSLAATTFPLPFLRPPTDELIALLQLPPVAKLHVPLDMKLTIRNHHPSRTANIYVQLDPDVSDGFVVAGLRSGIVPTLLPGAEHTLLWKLIPVECGFVRVPKLRVINRRQVATPPNPENAAVETSAEDESAGNAVKIVDVRWDGRDERGQRDSALGGPDVDTDAGHLKNDTGAVLVLP